jgi:F-type H+-transporting ATPase subunit delta
MRGSKINLNNHVKALFEIHKSEIQREEMFKDLSMLSEIFDREFLKFMESPLNRKSKKEEIIKSLKVGPNILSYLMILLDNNLIHKFHDIYKKIIEHNQIINKEFVIDVYLAKQITENEVTKIKRVLKNYFEASKIILQIHIEESLIGGMKVMYKDKALDQSIYSVFEQLQTLT